MILAGELVEYTDPAPEVLSFAAKLDNLDQVTVD